MYPLCHDLTHVVDILILVYLSTIYPLSLISLCAEIFGTFLHLNSMRDTQGFILQFNTSLVSNLFFFGTV